MPSRQFHSQIGLQAFRVAAGPKAFQHARAVDPPRVALADGCGHDSRTFRDH